MTTRRWHIHENRLITHQAGFTLPAHDFDAAAGEYQGLSADIPGLHGRRSQLSDLQLEEIALVEACVDFEQPGDWQTFA